MTTEKLLDKLSKMKRMAEGAKAIGSEAEAQAFAEALQRMLLEHKLSMSDLDFETLEKNAPVIEHRINYTQYGIQPKKTRVRWIEDLASIVARAHFCRILVYSGSSRITLVGKEEDIAVAEYLLITLQRAAEKISARAYDQYRNEERKKAIAEFGEEGRHGSLPHTFGFRESFLTAFIHRLHERLRSRQEEVKTSSSTALVRINRSEKDVADFMEAKEYGKATRLSRNTKGHAVGYARGRSAADAVDLGTKAVGGKEKGRLS